MNLSPQICGIYIPIKFIIPVHLKYYFLVFTYNLFVASKTKLNIRLT